MMMVWRFLRVYILMLMGAVGGILLKRAVRLWIDSVAILVAGKRAQGAWLIAERRERFAGWRGAVLLEGFSTMKR